MMRHNKPMKQSTNKNLKRVLAAVIAVTMIFNGSFMTSASGDSNNGQNTESAEAQNQVKADKKKEDSVDTRDSADSAVISGKTTDRGDLGGGETLSLAATTSDKSNSPVEESDKPAFHQDIKTADYSAAVDVPKNVFDSGTNAEIQEITDKTAVNLATVRDKLQEELGKKNLSVTGFKAYDISFFNGKDAAGKNIYVEPSDETDKIAVNFTWEKGISLGSADENLHVYHLTLNKDRSSIEQVKEVETITNAAQESEDKDTAEIQKDVKGNVTALKLRSSSFSIYAIAAIKPKATVPASVKKNAPSPEVPLTAVEPSSYIQNFKAEVFYGGTKDSSNPSTYIWDDSNSIWKENDNTGEKYIWNASKYASGHQYNFRVSFTLGAKAEKDTVFPAKTVKIIVPLHLLRDRTGSYADIYDMSIPSWDDVKEAQKNNEELDSDMSFAYEERDGHIEITNFRQIEAGFDGFIEMGYATSKKTFDYKDMSGSDDFTASISLMDPKTITDKDMPNDSWTDALISSAGRVYINTQVNPESIEQRAPVKYDSWQSSWGTVPKTITVGDNPTSFDFNSSDYTYFVYELVSRIGDNSQRYQMQIDDHLTQLTAKVTGEADPKEVEEGSQTGFALAYSFGNANAFGTVNTSSMQENSGLRYDYVLVAFNKTFFETCESLKIVNRTDVSVIPEDEIDETKKESAGRTFTWNKPVFRGTGDGYSQFMSADGYYRTQEANNAWPRVYFTELGMMAGNYSRYDLNNLSEKNKTLNDLDYALDLQGYPTNSTLDKSVTNTSSAETNFINGNYWKTPVKYELTDNAFYMSDEADGVKGNKENEELYRLTSFNDYQIDYLRFNVYALDGQYNPTEKRVDSKNGKFENTTVDDVLGRQTDILYFYGQYGSINDPFELVGAYNLAAKTWSDLAKEKGVTGEGDKLSFGDNCVGYKVETYNTHYYTRIGIVPNASLKASKAVKSHITMSQQEDDAGNVLRDKTDSIALNNRASLKIYDWHNAVSINQDGTEETIPESPYTNIIHSSVIHDADYIRGVHKNTQLTKDAVSSTNLRKKRKYEITWKIHMDESYMEGKSTGRKYVEQPGGTFYDLLPKGGVLDPNSILIETDTTAEEGLPSSGYRIDQEENWKGSGRTLVTFTIYDQANWYNLYYNTLHSYESIRDYGKETYNSIAYQTNNDTISPYEGKGGTDQEGEDAYSSFDSFMNGDATKLAEEKNYMYNLGKPGENTKIIYRGYDFDLAAITAAATGLTKRIHSTTTTGYEKEAVVKTGTEYSYRLRFQNSFSNSSKDIVFYDVLEGGQKDERGSDWRGTLKSISFGNLPKDEAGHDIFTPEVYYTTEQNVKIDDKSKPDLTKWKQLTSSYDELSALQSDNKITAVAIVLRSVSSEKTALLEKGQAVSVTLNMVAPAGGERNGDTSGYPEAYNECAVSYKRIMENSADQEDAFSTQGPTTAKLVITRDINVLKTSSVNNNPVSDISFKLEGTSDYGTTYNTIKTSDRSGRITFRDVEKGTYTLMEYGSNPDWLEDHTQHKVVINDKGELHIYDVNGTSTDDKGYKYFAIPSSPENNDPNSVYYNVKNDPRIHADVHFLKIRKNPQGNTALIAVPNTEFELSGTSDYQNDIRQYASSDERGNVKFSNVEKGTYTLKEIKENPDYLPNKTEYQVVVDESGARILADGQEIDKEESDYVIYNTPKYWDVSFLKVDRQTTNKGLVGAEFSLTGADLENELTAVSDSNGRVTFKHLKAGNYSLKETKAPTNVNENGKAGGNLSYTADPLSYIVAVSEDGTVTIKTEDGTKELEKNEQGDYLFPDDPALNGQITIIKKWEDGDGQNRVSPRVHLMTDDHFTSNKGITVYVQWLNDLSTTRPSRDFSVTLEKTKDGTTTTEICQLGDTNQKSYGNVWVFSFPDVSIEEGATYKAYENGLSVGTSNAYTGTATDGTSAVSVENGVAVIRNIYHNHTDFDFTGSVQTYTAPVSGTYELEVWGAQGGRWQQTAGGKGGYSYGKVHLNAGEQIYISVGGSGMNHKGAEDIYHDKSKGADDSSFSWNGGGVPGPDRNGQGASGVPGGGATSIQKTLRGDGQLKNYESVKDNDVLLVAGGGGGSEWTYLVGGVGGGESTNGIKPMNAMGTGTTYKMTESYIVTGGTQSEGGHSLTADEFKLCYGGANAGAAAKDVFDGSFGQGGYTNRGDGGGQGGGGWYGGGANNYAGGGAGGSGHIGTMLAEGETISGDQSFASPTGGNEIGHIGNGYARITLETDSVDELRNTSGSLSSSTQFSTDYVTDKLYDENNKDGDGWTKVDEHTWKYAVPVFNDQATYTVYEEGINGYRSSFASPAEPKPGEAGIYTVDGSKARTITVTNQKDGQYGGLDVTKNVVYQKGNSVENVVKDFPFTLTLSGTGIQSSGMQTIGGVVFNYDNGVATTSFTLKNGETKHFSDLPVGATYEVTENLDNDPTYRATYENQRGTISEDGSHVNVTNTMMIPDKKCQDITLTVKSSGTILDAEDNSYPFKAVFTGLVPNTEYQIQSGNDKSKDMPSLTSNDSGQAVADLSLKANQKAIFKDIPTGASYQMIEEPGDWTASYKITNLNEKGTINQSSDENTEKNKQLATAVESVEEDEYTTVTYTNELSDTQNLTVVKRLPKSYSDNAEKEAFSFTLKLKGMKPGTSIYSDVGVITADDMGEAQKEFNLKKDETVVFRKIPVGTTYELVEAANNYAGSYKITGGESEARKSFENSLFGLATSTGSIDSKDAQVIKRGVNPTVEFTNKALFPLPKTGGFGTKIFYVLGCGVLTAALLLLFLMRKRRSKD